MQSSAKSLPSLLVGFAGVATLAISSNALVAALTVVRQSVSERHEIEQAAVGILQWLLIAATYFVILFAMHVISGCELPLAARLTMIMVLLGTCLFVSTLPQSNPARLRHVLCLIPLGLGGLWQQRRRGWHVLTSDSATPPERPSQMTIAGLMDVTASIALVLAALGYLSKPNELGPWVFAYFVPASIGMMLFGLHVWPRLGSLCANIAYAESARARWLGINVALAFLVFMTIVVIYSTSPGAFLGFVAAPAFLLVTYVWTELPLRWLKRCGFRLVRHTPLKNDSRIFDAR